MSEVDEYLASIPAAEKKELERVRKIIKKAAPEAVELISYGMPGFKLKNKYLIGYAAFKHHMSIFPGGGSREALADQLKSYKQAKGTIQFTHDHPITDDLLTEIVKLRIADIDATLPKIPSYH